MVLQAIVVTCALLEGGNGCFFSDKDFVAISS